MTYWKDDKCIAVTTDPCHKTKGLYIGNRYVIQRVASFRNEEDAKAFENMLHEFLEPLLRMEDDLK